MNLIKFDRNSKNWKAPFFTIWGGQAFSLLGSNLISFALVWWLTQETGSVAVLATSTTLIYIPQIFLGPFIGALVDRWSRRKVMIIADTSIALLTALLAVLYWLDVVQLWHIFVLIFLRSIGGTFHFPAMQASTTMMVPEKHLARIAGLNQMLQGGVTIAGPPLGALLLSLIPISNVLMVDVLTAAIAVLPLLFIAIPQPENGTETETLTPKGLFNDVQTTFKWVFSWPGLSVILGISVLMNFLFTPVFSFMPLLITDHFNGGVWELSSAESIYGIGMISGGLLLSIWGGFKKKILTVILGLLGDGIGILLVGLAPAQAFMLALFGFFLAGLCNTLSNGASFALLQTIVPAEMQGRMMGSISALTGAMSPIGLLVAAPFVGIFGLQSWYILTAVLSIIATFACFFIPSVLKIEEYEMKTDKSGLVKKVTFLHSGD